MNKINLKKGIKFECQGSGNCCVSRGSYGYVYLSKKDLNKLSKHFNMEVSKFKKIYCQITNNFIHLKEVIKNKGNCIFLKDRKCSVYKSRPIQCRTWPFWDENMKAKEWNLKISKFCPGIGKGKLIKEKKLLKIIEKDKKNEELILKEAINISKKY